MSVLPNPKEMDDDALLNELVFWARVSRNEGKLCEKERAHLKEVSAEVAKRKLLKFTRP